MTVTYICDSRYGSISRTTESFTSGVPYGNLQVPTVTNSGYAFYGWLLEGAYTNVKDSDIAPNRNVTLRAGFIQNPSGYATLYFCGNGMTGGSIDPPVQINIQNKYTITGTPTRTGYTFKGWSETRDGSSGIWPHGIAIKLQSRAFILYAVWERQTVYVTVTYNAYPGSVSPSSEKKVAGSKYGTLPTPTRSGFQFDGWFTDSGPSGTRVTSDTIVPPNDHTIYARWTVVYTIRFNGNGSDGGIVPATLYLRSGEKGTIQQTDLRRTGFDLLGWSTSSTATTPTYYSGQTYSAEDFGGSVELFAVWKGKNYTVSFRVSSGHVSPTSKVVTYKQSYGDLPTPVYYDETIAFQHWVLSDDLSVVITPTSICNTPHDHTLTDVWIRAKVLTYDTQGGTPEIPRQVSAGSFVITDTIPSKIGFTFLGWSADPEDTQGRYFAHQIVSFESSTVLYAIWESIDVTIVFNAAGGVVDPPSKNVKFGEKIGERPTPKYEDTIFLGWCTEEDEGAGITAEETEIFAHWEDEPSPPTPTPPSQYGTVDKLVYGKNSSLCYNDKGLVYFTQ